MTICKTRLPGIFRGFLMAAGLLAASASALAEDPPSTWAGSEWLKRCRSGDWIQYSTDFEDVTLGSGGSQTSRLTSSSTNEPCRDATPLLPRVALGSSQVEYQGGSDAQRVARVIADPLNTGNQVLRFWLASPNVTDKSGSATERGRLQLNVYNNRGVREMLVVVRARLDPSFTALKNHYRSFDFLTIAEWWNNAPWADRPYPFRISVNIVKEQSNPGAPLRLAAQAQTIATAGATSFSTIWSQTQRNFEVPINVWMTIRYHLIEGSGDGHFRMTVTPDGQREHLVFDVQGPTRHPADPAPDGLAHFNPLKLYTAGPLLDAAKAAGYDGLTIDWDNLIVKVRDTPGTMTVRR